MSLEITRIPEFTHQFSESLHKTRHDIARHDRHVGIALLAHEIVSYGRNIDKSLKHDVRVVVLFDVVEAHNARQIVSAVVGSRQLRVALELLDLLERVGRVEHVLDVVERRVDDLIVVGQTVELERVQVDEYVMVDFDAVSVRVRFETTTLKVLAAYETGVNVVVRE